MIQHKKRTQLKAYMEKGKELAKKNPIPAG